jgi:hypothetical protein
MPNYMNVFCDLIMIFFYHTQCVHLPFNMIREKKIAQGKSWQTLLVFKARVLIGKKIVSS